jgi:hypothetical protein
VNGTALGAANAFSPAGPCFLDWRSNVYHDVSRIDAAFSFGLFLYQNLEFQQKLMDLRVKGHLLQNVGARFVKK